MSQAIKAAQKRNGELALKLHRAKADHAEEKARYGRMIEKLEWYIEQLHRKIENLKA